MSERQAAVRPHLILFDCDGTLMDSHHHIIRVMQLAFAGHDLPQPSASAVSEVIGRSLPTAVEKLLPREEATLIAAVVETYRHLYRDLPGDYALYAGVRETLDVLRERGYWMGVVTGKSLSGLERVLDEFSLAHYFLVIRTADHCPSKPHPGMVNECMAEMGVESEQTTVVGDALLDMQMAQASGVQALGVSFGVAEGVALQAEGAMGIVDAFDALLEYFPPLQNEPPLPTIR